MRCRVGSHLGSVGVATGNPREPEGIKTVNPTVVTAMTSRGLPVGSRGRPWAPMATVTGTHGRPWSAVEYNVGSRGIPRWLPWHAMAAAMGFHRKKQKNHTRPKDTGLTSAYHPAYQLGGKFATPLPLDSPCLVGGARFNFSNRSNTLR